MWSHTLPPPLFFFCPHRRIPTTPSSTPPDRGALLPVSCPHQSNPAAARANLLSLPPAPSCLALWPVRSPRAGGCRHWLSLQSPYILVSFKKPRMELTAGWPMSMGLFRQGWDIAAATRHVVRTPCATAAASASGSAGPARVQGPRHRPRDRGAFSGLTKAALGLPM